MKKLLLLALLACGGDPDGPYIVEAPPGIFTITGTYLGVLDVEINCPNTQSLRLPVELTVLDDAATVVGLGLQCNRFTIMDQAITSSPCPSRFDGSNTVLENIHGGSLTLTGDGSITVELLTDWASVPNDGGGGAQICTRHYSGRLLRT